MKKKKFFDNVNAKQIASKGKSECMNRMIKCFTVDKLGIKMKDLSVSISRRRRGGDEVNATEN